MEIKIVSTNRKAQFEYNFLEKFEAGLVLKGTEIKSIRQGQLSLQEAYVRVDGQQAWLVGAYIAPYEHAGNLNHKPTRDRKLLLKKREISELFEKVKTKGMTVVPIRAYIKNGLAKLEIGLARGKKQYDKRESIKERDRMREDARLRKKSYK